MATKVLILFVNVHLPLGGANINRILIAEKGSNVSDHVKFYFNDLPIMITVNCTTVIKIELTIRACLSLFQDPYYVHYILCLTLQTCNSFCV